MAIAEKPPLLAKQKSEIAKAGNQGPLEALVVKEMRARNKLLED